MKKIMVLINFFLIIFFFGISLWKEEGNLKKKTFYLKTAPADPRSIMQGDYMLLGYELGDEIRKNLESTTRLPMGKAYVRVRIDEKRLAHYLSLEKEYREEKEGEMSLEFYLNGFMVDLGINSYFFQEGSGEKFQNAQYAEVIPLDGGKLRLKALLDKNFQRIK
ncbi:MAG: GDYXXLXY domain-containing protein [Fusobacteriaceae bacterium]